MAITSDKLRELELVDEIIPEPLGGAHRNLHAMAATLKRALIASLDVLLEQDLDELLARRYKRVMSYGRFKE